MNKLLLILISAFFFISCSQTEPCNLKKGMTIKGCKEKSKSAFGKVKEGWKELKEKVEE